MYTSVEAPLEHAHIPWWVVLLQGIASVIIGVLLLTETGATLLTLVAFLGIYWLVGGIFDLVRLCTGNGPRLWNLLGGVVGILAGLVIVRHPLWAALIIPATLVVILAFLGIAMGILDIVRAFSGDGWASGILGALSIVFGLVLLANQLLTAVILVYSIGGLAIIGGISAVFMSFALRKDEMAGVAQRRVALGQAS